MQDQKKYTSRAPLLLCADQSSSVLREYSTNSAIGFHSLLYGALEHVVRRDRVGVDVVLCPTESSPKNCALRYAAWERQ